MNQNIQKLYNIASKPDRNIIGLMSGTSLDGLDIALCTFKGSGSQTSVTLRHFKTVSYSQETREDIRKVFAKKNGDLEFLTLLNPTIAILHGRWILEALEEWGVSPQSVDLIASHGQTIFHAPAINHDYSKFGNATLQLGDGDHLAVTTGIITISDFRQKHVAAGGEGAPLALYGDWLIFSKQGENRLLLNMGGIANFTFLPAELDPDRVLVTDTGPGNTLIDAFAQKHFGVAFDKDAHFASRGNVNTALLKALMDHPFFKLSNPKTTGPELFNLDYLSSAQARSGTTGLDPHDIIATLTKFSAETICDAIAEVRSRHKVDTIYASGGGAHNPFLMTSIQSRFSDIPIASTDKLEIPGDAKEAVLFAVLANETVSGAPVDFGGRAGMPAVTMGKISFPS